jgi:hypothetical protein
MTDWFTDVPDDLDLDGTLPPKLIHLAVPHPQEPPTPTEAPPPVATS